MEGYELPNGIVVEVCVQDVVYLVLVTSPSYFLFHRVESPTDSWQVGTMLSRSLSALGSVSTFE